MLPRWQLISYQQQPAKMQLALLNSYDIEGCERFNHADAIHSPLEDTFAIALGKLDRIGQVTHVLFRS